MLRIAINGFGRIGKNFLRTLLYDKRAQEKITVAAINIGKDDPEGVAFAFTYDTLMGTYRGPVSYSQGTLYVDPYVIPLINKQDPAQCPWKEYAIDWVVEATGHFTKRAGAEKHLKAGARSVLITAPAHGEDVTIIPGVNLHLFNPKQHVIISLGSCTTNALAPMLYVLERHYGVAQACMTTVHAYTNTQALLDSNVSSKDLRRGRAAALNIVPTVTGAMESIGHIMPELKGNISGYALRVPVAKVSYIDLTVVLKNKSETEHINTAYNRAAQTYLKHILGYSDQPLVSSDYMGNTNSVVIDSLMTTVQGTLGKVCGWYDNEWGYSERLKDFLLHIA